jgi:eukaryotic-like serine/threonine-protein kinase
VSKLDRIGRYSVRDRLGAGAFALVWLGHDDVLDEPVAIKVLAENWAHQLDLRARFVEEAKVLRRADSDRVVRVFDIGDLPDGRPYFVMTYADRGTLEERLTDGASLPVAQALRLAEQVARGVAVVHGLGVIHRDLKPSNVLFRSTVDDDERLLIADLGLSKALAHASGFTVAAGSPGYMAPEQQIVGGGIDIRVDVYGVGAMTYRMLTGVTPQTGPDGLVPPSQLREGLPAGTDSVLARALDIERERRWPSARALADALAELAGRVPPEPVEDEADDEPTVIEATHGMLDAPEDAEIPAEPAESSGSDRTLISKTALAAVPAGKPAATERVATERAATERVATQRGAATPPPARTQTAPPARGSAPPRPPSRPVTRAPRSRRRWPWVLTAILLVLCAGGAGVATVLVMRYQQNGNVTVRDSTGQLAITVPLRWAKEVQMEGWSPNSEGLGSEPKSAGLAVAANIASWHAGQQGTPGVFVGLSRDPKLPANVRQIAHADCNMSSEKYERNGFSGTLYHFTKCIGGVTYTEIGLTRTGSTVQIYVQITQPATEDRTAEILQSLQVTVT